MNMCRLLIHGNDTKSVSKASLVSFPACEGTWRAMNSTLTNRDVKCRSYTACVSLCDLSISQSPNLRYSSARYTLTGCDTAGTGQHRLIRSAPSRPADVPVAQNDLPASCATGPGPVAHPASRSMTSPSPSATLAVTVMIRPAADETTTRDGRPLAQAGTSFVADGPASYAR
jgi:hypothetical protein